MSDTTTPIPPGAEPPPPSDVRPVSITEELTQLLPRLRDERDRGARASRCRGRTEACASPHPPLDERDGYDWNKPYRKSARVVGDVIGKYHPHGDQSIYDALVRMVQNVLHAPDR